MNKFTLIILTLIVSLTAGATLPVRRTLCVAQSDGTQLTVHYYANGRYYFFATADGHTLVRRVNGDYVYAQRDASGELQPTACLAHEAVERSSDERAFVSAHRLTDHDTQALLSQRFPAQALQRAARATSDGLGAYGQPGGGVVSSLGAPVIPVIMVSFPDRAFLPETTIEKVTRKYNQPGYSDENGCVGSLRDYFTACSNGMFTPEFRVVARVTADKSFAYYGANGTSSIDLRCTTLVQEALNKAVAQGVDFAPFAVDSKGVPLVAIYYAGPGEQSAYETGSENYLWAHFRQYNFTAGKTSVNAYFVGNELLQRYTLDKVDGNGNYIPQEAKQDGIGIFAHEFSHALGLPDFYYTGSSDQFNAPTPYYWSIMDYGCYYYNGYAPLGYNAYERAFMGWQRVEELSRAGYYRLYAPAESELGNTAYVVRNPANQKEYYLLENRQPATWYPERYGSGMLVQHIDYNATNWRMNTVNNDASHQRVAIVPADNEQATGNTPSATLWTNIAGDLFPGTAGATELSDNSQPATHVFTGTKLGRPIYNISEEDGVIGFAFLDPTITSLDHLAAPTAINGETTVYTLEGRIVARAASAADVKALPAGAYLVKRGASVEKVLVK